MSEREAGTRGDLETDIVGIGALADPVRRELYGYVCAGPDPVSREAAADALGIPLHQAKFHLDRLVRDGLLEAGQARLTGRSGPGAGRPAKLYRRTEREVAVSLPAREYALAGEVLAGAVTAAATTGTPVLEAVSRCARERGRAIGRASTEPADGARPTGTPAARAAVDLALGTLARHGYEPRAEGGDYVLANCPFHALARAHTDLVCGMNLALLDGLLAEVDGHGLRARLDPAEGRCCVVLTPTAGGTPRSGPSVDAS